MPDLISHLVHFAQQKLPQLEYDINNAGSNPYGLQKALVEVHEMMTYIVHHLINERYALLNAGNAPVVAATPTPAPAYVAPSSPPQAQRPAFAPGLSRPGVTMAALPNLSPVVPNHITGPAAAAPSGGSKIAEVTLTPQGTRVSIPGGPQMTVPPGAPVDTASLMEPQPLPEGVVLPPGGGMTAEAAAAIAASSGGARNITQEPA